MSFYCDSYLKLCLSSLQVNVDKKRKNWSYESTTECGNAYRGPLSGIEKVFIRSLKWNGRCVVGKISQNCTKSCLTSIARIELRILQNGVRKKKMNKKIKEGQKYTWSSNPIIRRNRAFELYEEKSSSCTWRSNYVTQSKLAFKLKEEKWVATVRTLCAAFEDTES